MVVIALDNGWVDLQGNLLEAPPLGAEVLPVFPGEDLAGRADSLILRLRQAGISGAGCQRLPLSDGRMLILFLADGVRAARPFDPVDLDSLLAALSLAPVELRWDQVRRAVERKAKNPRRVQRAFPWALIAGSCLGVSLLAWLAAAGYQGAMQQRLTQAQQQNRLFHEQLARAVRDKAGAVIQLQQVAFDQKLLHVMLHAPLFDLSAYTLTAPGPLQVTLDPLSPGSSGLELAGLGKVSRKNDQFTVTLP